MGSKLITHSGARVVTRAELTWFEPPAATATWFPLKHSAVIETAMRALVEAGFAVRHAQYALARSDARLFAVMDLECPLVEGVLLAVGVRSATDKSLPLSFCAGSRVMVCENLAFSSEILVARKHTRFGAARFEEAIKRAVASLSQFREAEYARIERFREAFISDVLAESALLRCYERGVLSHRMLPEAIRQWREPVFEQFRPRNLWSLENALTGVLSGVRKTNAQRFVSLSLAAQALLAEVAGLGAPAADAAVPA